jgi:hypothetical protein
MIEKLLAANLLPFALAAASGCATSSGWKCEVQRYGNRATDLTAHHAHGIEALGTKLAAACPPTSYDPREGLCG